MRASFCCSESSASTVARLPLVDVARCHGPCVRAGGGLSPMRFFRDNVVSMGRAEAYRVGPIRPEAGPPVVEDRPPREGERMAPLEEERRGEPPPVVPVRSGDRGSRRGVLVRLQRRPGLRTCGHQLGRRLEGLRPAFEESEGIELVVSYGGSQMLAQQIAQGAPADLFIPAREAPVRFLAERGVAVGADRLLASNELVAVTRMEALRIAAAPSPSASPPRSWYTRRSRGLPTTQAWRTWWRPGCCRARAAGACLALEWERRGCWRRASPFRLGGIDPPPSYSK